MKTHCKRGHEFTIDNTYVRTNGTRRCRECIRADSRERGKTRTKQYHRAVNLKHFYGLTLEAYEALLKFQCYTCANPGCDALFSDDSKFHVDHNHACCPGRKSCGKCVRGLLCSKCNLLLGLAEDNTRNLQGLVEYLEWSKYRHRSMLETTPTTRSTKMTSDSPS